MYTFQGPFGLSLTFNLDCMQYMDSGKIILRLKVGVSMESRMLRCMPRKLIQLKDIIESWLTMF